MDNNKIDCKNCKKNIFWSKLFNLDIGSIGKLLMSFSFIVALIIFAIKLSTTMSLIDVTLIICIILFAIGFVMFMLFV